MLNKNSKDDGGGTIALTIGLVLSLLGLFAASVVVFLKWRKKSGPAKKAKKEKRLSLIYVLDLFGVGQTAIKSIKFL